jgi:hypothetical protein
VVPPPLVALVGHEPLPLGLVELGRPVCHP